MRIALAAATGFIVLAACVVDDGDGDVDDDAGSDVDAGAAVGYACTADLDCASGLCATLAGVCVENACDDTRLCGDGLVCAGNQCGRTCTTPAARGETCLSFSDDDPCSGARHDCAAPLVCAVSDFLEFGHGACAPATERARGEPCDVDDVCASATCDPATLTCG